MESGKDLPGNDSGGGGGRSSSEREFDCKGCGAKNVVKKSEGTPTPSSRKRRWREAAALVSEAGAGAGGGNRMGNRLFNKARARKLNGEQGRKDGWRSPLQLLNML